MTVTFGHLRRTVLAALVCLFVLSATAALASAETTTYTATQTIPVPPASNFAGSGGGDGWAVALSETAVYNVFHHNGVLEVACHLQADAKSCFEPETITDESKNNFSTSGHPGLYLDQHTGKLYVYATRTVDGTAGVVCIDTTIATTNPDPFCGFTALTNAGEAPNGGFSATSSPMLIGSHWYSFNYVPGKEHKGAENALMCFDASTDAACAGQPYAVAFGSGTMETSLPSPSTAAIGNKVILPVRAAGGEERLACFDDATQGTCAGSWPVSLPGGTSYVGVNGAPFPLLAASGKTEGFCIPTGVDQCFNLDGSSAATPAKMPSVITDSDPWNGPALVLGPRVYVPTGNVGSGAVECFDYATGEGCTHFPKEFTGLGYLYTVNADPQRPTCIWVNSNDGADQIQNFDAYTGEACGQGTIRALASQFVVPQPQCTPASYVSLQVLKPARSTYTSGSVAFDDGDGNPIGLPERSLDESGTASLTGLELNTPTGLPQFLFTLTGEKEELGAVEVQLTWLADYNASCIGEHTTATAPTPTPTPTPAPTPKSESKPTPIPAPAPKGGVLAFGAAHLASSANACVASTGYLASVAGSSIASVTFTVNGHKIATVRKANPHGAFTTRIKLPVGGKEKLAMKVTFTVASKTHAVTLHRTLARCAAARPRPTPRFTG
jgi:hypothetical protein